MWVGIKLRIGECDLAVNQRALPAQLVVYQDDISAGAVVESAPREVFE